MSKTRREELTHIASPGVEEHNGALGDDFALKDEVLVRCAGKREAEDGEVSVKGQARDSSQLRGKQDSPQTLTDQSSDVRNRLVVVGVAKRVVHVVNLLNRVKGLLLDLGVLRQEANRPRRNR